MRSNDAGLVMTPLRAVLWAALFFPELGLVLPWLELVAGFEDTRPIEPTDPGLQRVQLRVQTQICF